MNSTFQNDFCKRSYVVTLKSNHLTLYNQVKTWLEMAKAQQFEGIEVSQYSRTENGHRERRN